MSLTFKPSFLSTFGTAKTGPMPISSGSHPATAKPRKRPRGFRLFFDANSSLTTTHAPAPSENWLALPAVITPPGSAGLLPLMPSYVVPSRRPSSLLAVTCFVIRPSVASATPAVTVIGAISSLNLPASCAAHAFCWLAAPYSSCASLPLLLRLATCSAVCSIDLLISGFFSGGAGAGGGGGGGAGC